MNDKIIIEQSKWIAYTSGKRNEKGDFSFIKVVNYFIIQLLTILFLTFLGWLFKNYYLSSFLIISLYSLVFFSIPYKEVYIVDQEGVHFEGYLIPLKIMSIIALRAKVGKTHFFISWDKVDYWAGNGIPKHPYMIVKGLATEWTDISNKKYSNMYFFEKRQHTETIYIYPKGDKEHASDVNLTVHKIQKIYRAKNIN